MTRVDPRKRRFLLETADPETKVFLEGAELVPVEEKVQRSTFFSETFLELYLRWYEYGSDDQVLSFCAGGRAPMRLSVRDKWYAGSVTVGEIVSRFTSSWGKYPQDGSWVIMDCDTRADDNGEHFYRYMMREHPEQECYFVLRRSSADWDRLEQEGFNLLDFGSVQHEEKLRQCSAVVSSQADMFVHSYFGDNFYQSKVFAFLQHGVTMNDLSSWLNRKPISLFVTSTPAERSSIVDDGSPYLLTPSQVILSGFPRHDELLKERSSNATILIMPTWRLSLSGKANGKGSIREIHPEFADSEYKKEWEKLLNDNRLKELSERSGLRVVFYPHANTAPYMEQGFFKVPDYIELASNSAGSSIQQCFREAAVMITDYSSTAFEVAYLKKPCLYYQFDKEEFFSGTQVYAKGYFDYERDGFGPVAYTEDELLAALEDLAACGFEPQEPYRTRMEETFPFRDGKCCERVYEAIKSLDEPARETSPE